MNRDERQRLRAIADEVSGWVKIATPVRAQRRESANASAAARTTLLGSVVDVSHHGEIAWRVLPLRSTDSERLQKMAHYQALPRISPGFRDALKELTEGIPNALKDVRTLTGTRRFFSSDSTKDLGQKAADHLAAFRSYFLGNGMLETLRHLAAQKVTPPGRVPISDALDQRVGLAHSLGELGGSPTMAPASMFAELPWAVATVRGAADQEARCRTAAVDAGNNVRRAEAERLLADMGVDRLKEATRDKIRTGPLTDAGVSTVKQVLEYRWLETLPGIGSVLATRIRGAAQTLWQTTYDEMPARIDIKNRTAQATHLLNCLRVWDALRKSIGGTKDLDLAADFAALGHALDDRVGCAVVVDVPGRTVEDFHTTMETLMRRARLLTGARATSQADDPWEDFLARPADYFALLGELGFITEDAEKVHGDLPEDIIEAVRALELKTEYLRASLRGYQSFGARFALVQRKVIIGDEMGLGKTVEALAVLAHLRAKGLSHFLVVCPAAVVTNWVREISSKSALAAHRLHGGERSFGIKTWIRNGGVAVTTFETLPWLLQHRSVPALGCIVVDEAHYIKNPSTRRTQRVRQITDRCDRAMLLTGTPLENRIEEFRNLVSYLRPDLLVDENGIAPRRFRRQVAPAYLRRNQEDVLTELPECVEVDEWLPMSQEDSVAYREAVAAGNFMAMRQAAMRQGGMSTKMQRLIELVKEAEDNGRRVVVFSYFRDVLSQAAAALPGPVFGPLTGSVPAVQRQIMVDQFSAAGHGAVLVSQIVAGGVGLNIQAASVVVICEPQLKPTTEWQAIARARRMGQLESVQVHRLVSEEGVDQRIREILADKRLTFEEFARISETAESAPEAYDVSEADLAREVIAAERERLFSQPD